MDIRISGIELERVIKHIDRFGLASLIKDRRAKTHKHRCRGMR